MTSISLLASRTLRTIAALLLVTQIGCSFNRAAPSETAGTVPLVFANETSTLAEVWVGARDFQSRRLGTVVAGETATLRVPAEFYAHGVVNFNAKLREGTTNPGVWDLRVSPDEHLRIRLPRDAKALVVSR